MKRRRTGSWNYVECYIKMKKKCIICRQLVGFWSNRHIINFFNSYTGEDNLCVCGRCLKIIEYSLHNRGGLNLFQNSREANTLIRIAYERNLLTKSQLEIIQKDEAKVRAERTIGVATGWIVYDYDNYLLLNDESRRIVINGNVYDFADIKDYSVRDESVLQNVTAPETTTYSTKTKSGMTRTIAGKVFAGNVGAAMGALTADHSLSIKKGGTLSYEREQHDFSIYVNFRQLSKPSELLKIGQDVDAVIMISNVFDKILQREKKTLPSRRKSPSASGPACGSLPQQPSAPKTSSITFCPQCGGRNLSSSRFCTSCGSLLRPEERS